MKTIKHIIRGMGYLEGFGYHPGNWMMVSIMLIGGIAGIDGGWRGFFGGFGIVFLGMLPMYMYGCYTRSVNYEKDRERTFNILATVVEKQQ
jgi:hypothetical protein